MKQPGQYKKYIDLIRKEEFDSLFSSNKDLQRWFSKGEMEEFSFPRNSRSLAARYLVKKRICDQLNLSEHMSEIEILNDSFGKPEISFSENMSRKIEQAGVLKILCSLSHSRNYITGMTIFCF